MFICYRFVCCRLNDKKAITSNEISIITEEDAEHKLALLLVKLGMPDGFVSVRTSNGAEIACHASLYELAGRQTDTGFAI